MSEVKIRCHYEVMGVAREASTEEIKKAYKKLALQWHPDRNYGQEELAAKTFKEISASYSVLSDPQERQWYDDHREAILRGKDFRGEGDDEEDDVMPNLFNYFTTTCFSDFNDEEGGFYDVYSDVFEEILDAEEERGTGRPELPEFGDSESSESEVYDFYTFWENFVTTATFAWHDKYNTLEAPNRQVKRAMEKENAKFRDAARKEYMSNVKQLVAFVKKRDPRYAAFEEAKKQRKAEEAARKLEAKKLEVERKKAEREKWRQAAEEEREAREKERERAFLLADNDSDMEDDDDDRLHRYATTADLPPAEGDPETVFAMKGLSFNETPVVAGEGSEAVEASEEGGDDDEEDGSFNCEACAKAYKTAMQLNQHLQSKNHRKKVQELEKAAKKKGGSGKAKK